MLPIFKTLQSLKKARLFSVLLSCALLALLTIFALITLVSWSAAYLSTFEQAWINNIITIAAGLLTGIAGWFILPSLIVLIGSIYQDSIIKKVEHVYYPQTRIPQATSFWPDLIHDIKFTVKAVFFNLCILPLYLLGIGFLGSVILNSYLLGREFFETAAGHYLGKEKAYRLIEKNRLLIYGNGLVITLFSLLPIINIFMPVLGLIYMVHIFHKIYNPKLMP